MYIRVVDAGVIVGLCNTCICYVSSCLVLLGPDKDCKGEIERNQGKLSIGATLYIYLTINCWCDLLCFLILKPMLYPIWFWLLVSHVILCPAEKTQCKRIPRD